MLNVERLRILAELSRRGTLRAVAEALSFSTSAVSQQLRQLEKDVGVPLVERVGRGLVLTPQGELLAARAHVILAEVERAEADVVASTGEPRGTVTVDDVARHHPGVDVVFRLGEPAETLPALPGAEVDVALVESYPGATLAPVPGVTTLPLLEDPLWLALSPGRLAALDTDQDPVAQLSGAGWAVEPEGTAPHAWLVELCRRRGFDPHPVCVSEDLAVQLAFVASGHAVAVLPGLTLASAPPEVVTLPLGDPAPSRTVTAAWRENAGNRRAARAVLESLQRVARDLAPPGQLSRP